MWGVRIFASLSCGRALSPYAFVSQVHAWHGQYSEICAAACGGALSLSPFWLRAATTLQRRHATRRSGSIDLLECIRPLHMVLQKSSMAVRGP